MKKLLVDARFAEVHLTDEEIATLVVVLKAFYEREMHGAFTRKKFSEIKQLYDQMSTLWREVESA